MNAFTAAIAAEVARTRSELTSAKDRRDESAVTDAQERLQDLSEICERALDGLHRIRTSATP